MHLLHVPEGLGLSRAGEDEDLRESARHPRGSLHSADRGLV